MSSGSYKVLARKYRPRYFSELIGQDTLVTTLTNAIKLKRIHHGYVLSGTRGIGKTTTARIIAKNLNCIGLDGNGIETITPCGECVNCVDIQNNCHPDIIEFDAASNTGIDDVKGIMSTLNYETFRARYRVFIVDEVHMLSTKAFNSLLKTLEEPPSNVVFIFATTEINKVPITILSRCQKFILRTLSDAEIADHITNIAKIEGYEVTPDAAILIAQKADGSVRDSLSLLDQMILNASINTNNNESGSIITKKLVIEALSFANQDDISLLFSFIIHGDVKKCLETMDLILKNGIDEANIIADLLSCISEEIKLNALKANQEKPYPLPTLMRLWQFLVQGFNEIKQAWNKKIYLSTLLIKLCYASNIPTIAEMIERLNKEEIDAVLSTFDGSSIVE